MGCALSSMRQVRFRSCLEQRGTEEGLQVPLSTDGRGLAGHLLQRATMWLSSAWFNTSSGRQGCQGDDGGGTSGCSPRQRGITAAPAPTAPAAWQCGSYRLLLCKRILHLLPLGCRWTRTCCRQPETVTQLGCGSC